MKYNVIENGDYVLGKAEDIVEYLLSATNELSSKYLNDEIDIEELKKYSEENIRVVKEIREEQYQLWVILKLYRNEKDELDYEDLSI